MSLKYAANTVRCFYNYHTQKKVCGNYPIIQDIEVTNACNLNCVFCQRPKINSRGIGYMSKETFNRIFTESNRSMLRHTRLFMHGEPLLHPDIVEFVRTAKQYSKTVGFTCNGTLMTSYLASELLDAGLNTVCFSFEGTDKATYEKLRVGSNFELVKNNIQSFLDQNKKRGNTCQVNIAIIDHPLTHDKLTEFQAYWKTKLNVVVLKLHDWGLNGSRVNSCLWPWWGLAIYWNGDIVPCCLSESSALGNVNEQSIINIWGGHNYRVFRENFMNNNICQTCSLSNRTFVDSYLKTESIGTLGFIKNLYGLGKAVYKRQTK